MVPKIDFEQKNTVLYTTGKFRVFGPLYQKNLRIFILLSLRGVPLWFLCGFLREFDYIYVDWVLSDHLTPDLGWGDRVGREGRDSRHSPIRVGTGGLEGLA